MGQRVVQVMLGIDRDAHDTPNLSAEDGDPLWDHAGLTKKGRLQYQDMPDYDEDGRIVGFRVAAGPAYEDGEGALFDVVALEDFATHHSGPISAAQAKWTAFAIWMQTQCNVTLPKPRLYLCMGERA